MVEKRSIESFFTKAEPRSPGAKKAKAAAAAPEAAPSDAAPAAAAAAAPSASNTPDETAADGGSMAQKERMEANKQAAVRKRLYAAAVSAAAAGATPNLDDLLVEQTWRTALAGEFAKEYWGNLKQFLGREPWEWGSSAQVFPATGHIFRAFNTCPMARVKVVILGQDPYHDVNQAMGLSFSVPQGQKVPSSLQNIFKELGTDLGCGKPTHGDLDKWATQGVLMINASLTVRAHTANSHSKKGWEIFTDAAIRALAKQRTGVVFLLWGKNAQEKKKLIGKEGGHLILECPHPSGLSAHRGFYGCKHFSQANAFIESNGGAHIDWQIEPHNEYVAR